MSIPQKRLRSQSPERSASSWHSTIEKVVKSVVSIQFAQVASFDCESALISEATGFVVDTNMGIIMTNRHVVGAGPFCGYAVFDNHEESDLIPIYCDPVHDFGFLRFDPSKIRYMKIQRLKLCPEKAQVGTEIRVVGNDNGEKLSILSGFISRIDRNAPDYGELTYNDFNTEYIQAAASASGGSSGSPVVDIDGDAVAIQAGGSTEASTDFFLPLNRGLRALECIQKGLPVTRGTIQTHWMLKPFEECRRLDLAPEAEKLQRELFPGTIGMLVAETVLPGGPASPSFLNNNNNSSKPISKALLKYSSNGDATDQENDVSIDHITSDKSISGNSQLMDINTEDSVSGILEGDVLLKIGNTHIASFIQLDSILDENIGQTLDFYVNRNGIEHKIPIKVHDLYEITPDRYVEVCGASFHNLSYQLARIYAIPVKGVYLAECGGSFRFDGVTETKGWLIDAIDDQETPNLDRFIEVIGAIPDGRRVTVKYRHLRDPHTTNFTITYIDRHWHKTFRYAVRNDVTGKWDFTNLAEIYLVPPKEHIEPRKAAFTCVNVSPPNSKIALSMVRVSCMIPVKLDGFPRSQRQAHGLVIDADLGLVVVSRSVVPYDLSVVSVTIAESVVVPAKVVFLHPLQNWTVVQYDSKLIDAPIKSAELASTPLKQGDELLFMGHNHNLRMISTETKVSDITPINIPPNPGEPYYRAINLDAITVDSTVPNGCTAGVLATDGKVRALWLSCMGERTSEGRQHEYRLAIDASTIKPTVDEIRSGNTPSVRFLDIEVGSLSLIQARIRGVPSSYIEAVEADNSDRHQLFEVTRTAAPGPNSPPSLLKEGDIILTVNGTLLTRISGLDAMYSCFQAELEIVRNKKLLTISSPTVTCKETSHIVFWCGALLQAPHHAVRQQITKLHSGVYVAHRANGSPAYQYLVAATNFITHVNGVATPDLDTFLSVVTKISDNSYAKLRIVTFDNIAYACSIKMNYHYFPTSEMRKIDGQWDTFSYKDGIRINE